VCTENLNTGVAVMKSTQDGVRTDDAGPLNRARNRRIVARELFAVQAEEYAQSQDLPANY
jgi:hypothetical protein